MIDARTLYLMLPRAVRRFPTDLAAIVALVVATGATFVLPEGLGTPLRILFGVPFVLFAPGYVVTAALFPERGGERSEAAAGDGLFARSLRGVSKSERALFSVWLSIAIVPMLGLAVNFSPWSIRPATVLGTVAAFTLALAVVAAVRRWGRRSDERFEVGYDGWVGGIERFTSPDSRADLILNVLLAASVLLAAGSVAYAVTVPEQEQSFTEFYLLSEDASGELVAEEYPDEFRKGQGKPLTVGISNHEGRAVNYTVVALLQRVEADGGRMRVTETERLGRFGGYVEDDGTLNRRYVVTPTMTGTRLRVRFLLYRGAPPADPTAENAYRKVHFWVNVSQP